MGVFHWLWLSPLQQVSSAQHYTTVLPVMGYRFGISVYRPTTSLVAEMVVSNKSISHHLAESTRRHCYLPWSRVTDLLFKSHSYGGMQCSTIPVCCRDFLYVVQVSCTCKLSKFPVRCRDSRIRLRRTCARYSKFSFFIIFFYFYWCTFVTILWQKVWEIENLIQRNKRLQCMLIYQQYVVYAVTRLQGCETSDLTV